jgi:ankyrin repeat protein
VNDKIENFQQDLLITRFNEFARLAKEYLGIEIDPLNERGCCFALAQYNIKHASEGTLDQFYQFNSYIASHFTADNIPDLLTRAKVKLTDEEKLAHASSQTKPSKKYNDFQIPAGNGSIRFSDLMDFVQGISKAQVGYTSDRSKGRFAKEAGQSNLGRFENIAGNWENSYVISGNKDTLVDALRRAHLTDHHYVLIQSGNHAINFRRTPVNQFVVYDSNDTTKSKTLNNLSEVAGAILTAFGKVGNLSDTGHVVISLDTVSLGDGDREFQSVIREYRHSLLHSRPTSGLAKECHEIMMKYHPAENNAVSKSDLRSLSSNIFKLYGRLKSEGKVENRRDFVKKLPPALQYVALESLNYLSRSYFVRAVEGKTSINYDSSKLNQEQNAFMSKINEYFLQHKEGFLSRADFALNVTKLITKFEETSANTQNFKDFQKNPIFAELMHIKHFLGAYLEGAVTVADVLLSTKGVKLNERDKTGYSLANMAFEASPNKTTLQALCEQGEKSEKLSFNIENPKDFSTLRRLLIMANTEAVDYLMTKMDLNQVLCAENFKLLKSVMTYGNVEVTKLLLKTVLNTDVNPRFDINQKLDGKNILQVAVKFGSDSLALFSLDNGVRLTSSNADEILKQADLRRLTRNYERIRERQAYTYAHFKEDFQNDPDKKSWKEPDFIKAWEAVDTKEQEKMERQAGLKADEQIKPYTFEQFQKEHPEDFKAAAAWSAVIDHIIDSDNKDNRHQLFDIAVRDNHLEIAERIFLKDQRDSPEWEAHQEKLFKSAVIKGDLAMLKRILLQDPARVKVLVNGREAQKSVLSMACERGHNEIVELLLRKGAEVRGDTSAPLSYAAEKCSAQICEDLVARGGKEIDRSAVSKRTRLTGVMLSRGSASEKDELVRILFKQASKFEALDTSYTHEAVIEAAKVATTTSADINMITEKFNINLAEVRSADGKTPAMLSLENDNFPLMQHFIVDAKLDLDHNSQLLRIAIDRILFQEVNKRRGHADYKPELLDVLVEQVKGWIKKTPDLINKPFSDGTTPLMRAAQSGNVKIVKRLIKKGANIDAVNNTAARQETPKTAIHFAVDAGNQEIINLLVDKNADLTIQDANGNTPLHRLAKMRPTLSDLIALKGDEGLKVQDANGDTILHHAVRKIGDKNRDLIKALLTEGLDPLKPNNKGETALDIALSEGYLNSHTALAIAESLTRKSLSNNRPVLDQLKAHKADILDALKKELGDTNFDSSEAKATAAQRVSSILKHKNGLAQLFRAKFRMTAPPTANQGVSKASIRTLRLDRDILKELKEFKRGFLEEEPARKRIRSETPRQLRNL